MFILEPRNRNRIFLCFRNIVLEKPTILDEDNNYIKFIPITYKIEVSKLISSTIYNKEISFKELLAFIKRKELEKEDFKRVEIFQIYKNDDNFWTIEIFEI